MKKMEETIMMKRRLLALALCLALALGLCACGSSSQDEDSAVSSTTSEDVSADVSADTGDGELTAVTVQLKWVQQAQFMGYYAAKELGIYEAYGLDVTIVPGGSVDVVDEVDSGRAEFGVTWVSTLMSAVSNGANVMAVAQYYQDSGMTLVSLDGTVEDATVVTGDEVTGNWGGGNEYEMQAYLSSLGLSTEYVTQDYDMQQLLDGDITWASAMTYNELGLVLESGYTLDDLNILYMEDEGFGMLEDCLIVDTAWAEENEDIVTAFVAASSLGWAWCLENTTAAGSLVFNAEDTANTVSEYHQQFEADEVAKLIAGSIITVGDRDSYTLVGYMDADKYEQTYDILSEYVDVSNTSADSVYTTYFYDEAVAGEQYLSFLEDFDSLTWDGSFDVLYEG